MNKLLLFFAAAKEALKESDYEEEAFYFEQVEDYLRETGKVELPVDKREVGKILGL